MKKQLGNHNDLQLNNKVNDVSSKFADDEKKRDIPIEWNQIPTPPENMQQNPNQSTGQTPRSVDGQEPKQTNDQDDGQNNGFNSGSNGGQNFDQQPNPEPVLQYISSLAIENKNFNLITLTKRQISILAIASTNTFSTLLQIDPGKIEKFSISTPNNRYWVTPSFLKIGILTNTTQVSQCNPEKWDKNSNEDSALSTGLTFNFQLNTTESELKNSIGIRQNSRLLQNSPNSQYFANFLRDKLIQDGGNAFLQLNNYYILEVGKALKVPTQEVHQLASYFYNSPNEVNAQLSCARVQYIGNSSEEEIQSPSPNEYVNASVKLGSTGNNQTLFVAIPLFIICLIVVFAMFIRNFTCKESSEETIRLNENV